LIELDIITLILLCTLELNCFNKGDHNDNSTKENVAMLASAFMYLCQMSWSLNMYRKYRIAKQNYE